MLRTLAAPFIAIWALYWVILAIAPIKSRFYVPRQFLTSGLIEVTFVAIVFILMALVRHFWQKKPNPDEEKPVISSHSLGYLTWILLGLSAMGLLMICFDRILIQKVDYSLGFTLARGDWREKSMTRVGVSSVFSVLGNFFFPLVYVNLAIVGRLFRQIRFAWLKAGVSFLMVLSFSLLTGGREGLFVVILIIAFVFYECYVRPKKIRKGNLLAFAVGMVLIGMLTTSFFHFRSKASGQRTERYVSLLVNRLGGKLTAPVCGPTSAETVCVSKALAFGGVSYLVHSRWMLDLAIASRLQKHTIQGSTFSSFKLILRKLRLTGNVHPPWELEGYFLSMPGSLFYDYGLLGVIGIAPFLCALFLLYEYCSVRSCDIFMIPMRFVVFAIAVASPVLVVWNFIPFLYTAGLSTILFLLRFFSSRMWSRGPTAALPVSSAA